MLATTYAPAILGIDGQLITIECDMSSGLPGLVIVGLGDKAVEEARERIRSAIKNSGFTLPPKRITLNLAPADLPKDGSGYDLGMAIAILCASGQLDPALVGNTILLGELSLNGDVKPARGALTAAQLCLDRGFDRIITSESNAPDAAQIDGVKAFGIKNLTAAFHHLNGQEPLSAARKPDHITPSANSPANIPDMRSIYGQHLAKRAVEIATAGDHNLLLTGPPGTGKTMLAKATLGLLPPLSSDESIEVTKIHSLVSDKPIPLITSRPFRAPHHTASSIALIGGGSRPRPGEMSLAHHGVLFMDEIPEFPRSVLEVLRQPLEEEAITIARAAGSITFPANVMLIATANPCACGYYGDAVYTCRCTLASVERYQHKISGPLLDRIDLMVSVHRPPSDQYNSPNTSESTSVVAQRIKYARDIQMNRNHGRLNSKLQEPELWKHCKVDNETSCLLTNAIENLGLSVRAYAKTIRIARTIADLEGQESITAQHVTEALQYRPVAPQLRNKKPKKIPQIINRNLLSNALEKRKIAQGIPSN